MRRALIRIRWIDDTMHGRMDVDEESRVQRTAVIVQKSLLLLGNSDVSSADVSQILGQKTSAGVTIS